MKGSKGEASSNIQGKPHMFNSWSFSRNSAGQKGIAKHIQSTEREKSTSKISLPSKDLTQNWWRNQKLFRQAKVKRIQYHQTSITMNVKGTYIVKKCKRRKRPTKSTQNNEENGNRNIYINDYFKCKQIKCSNQNTQTGWMDTKTRPIYKLSTRNTLQI